MKNWMIATAIIALACFVVNPLGLDASSNKNKEVFQDLIDLLLNEGGEAQIYTGELARAFDLPDPAPTRNIDAVPKWSTEPGRADEEVTDNWFHSCSLFLEKIPDGTSTPAKLLFQARKESGRDSETYHFKTSLDGTLEKVEVNHGKLDENGEPIQGSAINASAFLDIESAKVKLLLRHELDLWLAGKYFKKKFRKKHLEDLAYYRNKRNPPIQKKKNPEASHSAKEKRK